MTWLYVTAFTYSTHTQEILLMIDLKVPHSDQQRVYPSVGSRAITCQAAANLGAASVSWVTSLMADFRWRALGCIDQTRNRMDFPHQEFPDRPQTQTIDRLWILWKVTFKVTKVKQDQHGTVSEAETWQWHTSSAKSLQLFLSYM